MKKHLAAAGLALSTVIGSVAVGATMFVPTVATAQESDSTPDTPPEAGAECPKPGHRRGAHLEVAAEAIGISVEDLRAQLKDGTTIADVAAANGVDVQTVIDAMVADVKAHLDEAVANGDMTREQADERLDRATERITDHVNNAPPPPARRRG